MIRLSEMFFALMLGGATSIASAQETASPRPAHSQAPLPEGGQKANPADAASPPLADPLKQQAVTDPPQTLTTPAVQFIMQASMDCLADVQLAQVALKQANSATVRRFARRMLADQRVLNVQLEALATEKGTSVPQVLDSDHAVTVQRLAALSGPTFDSAYAAQTRTASARTVTAYRAASRLNDVDVSRFASGALPKLDVHAADARLLN